MIDKKALYAALKGGQKYIKKLDLKDLELDDVLDQLGLEQKSVTSTVLSGLGFFAFGLLVGSAVGLILAPMTGDEMRSTLKEGGVKGVMDRTRGPMATPSA